MIPHHVAIIMDGNGRWAESRHQMRFFGHQKGAEKVREISEEAQKLGIQALTLFAFSTENWKRPEDEIQWLWKLLEQFLKREEATLMKNNIQLHVIGEPERLPEALQKILNGCVSRLSKNTGLKLTFALSYGSRREIRNTIQAIAQRCMEGSLKISDISEELISDTLSTHFLKPFNEVDLVIRTSGEFRISNFLLWQSAYAEYVFLEKYWPDFEPQDLRNAVEEFGKRNRRFGKSSSSKTSELNI